MKLFKLKAAAGAAALLVIGAAAYTLAQAGPAKPVQDAKSSLDGPVNASPAEVTRGGAKDAARNVLLTGKIRYEDGRPAGGVEIDAQMQNKFMQDKVAAAMKRRGVNGPGTYTYNWTKQEQEESWNKTLSNPDGTYSLPVGAGVPYNVMVFDATGKWVASAVEGTSGAQNSTVKLPDLLLTRGSLITGRVTTIAGLPAPFVAVGNYGPSRPATTAASGFARTDLTGRYRLRVAPGLNRVYSQSALGSSSSKDADKTVTVAAGAVQTVDLVQ